MDKKDYDAALKEVKTSKVGENFMLIEFYYNKKVILPYKDGVTVMAALANAEWLHDGYGEKHRIAPIEKEAVKASIFSRQLYEEHKVATLLGVNLDELQLYKTAKLTEETPS